MRVPKIIYSLRSTIIFVACLVFFALFFAIIYTPNYGLSEEATSLSDLAEGNAIFIEWYKHIGLCLPVTCAIILATTTLSRTIMLLCTHTSRLRENEYFWWQLAEVAVTAIFCNLFLSLYLHYNYIEHLPMSLLIYISVAIYPYAFYWLLAERLDRDRRIAEAQRTIVLLRQRNADSESSTIRFADEKGVVKLVVNADRVLYIESAGNYATIVYENEGKLVRYSLRNTLKGIEETCRKHRLVRCHRSYFVNLAKVRLMRRTPEGLFAQLDFEGLADLPVSKSYATEVFDLFSNGK